MVLAESILLNGRTNGAMEMKILLVKSVAFKQENEDETFQQDKDPKHTLQTFI